MALSAEELAVVKRNIGGAESGGNPNAKNSQSSASGTYQFIDSTFLGIVKQNPQNFPQFAGMDKAQILANKNDPLAQSTAMDISLNNYQSVLTANGLDATPGNLYTCHFLGPNTAATFLKSDPNASVDQVLKPEVLAANKALLTNPDGSFKTVGQVQDVLGKKAGGAVAGAPGGGTPPGGAAPGGGAGCAAGALMGIAGMAAGGLLGGLGAGISGALGGAASSLGLSGLTGALSGIQGAIGGALGSLTGALGGALGGLTGSLGGILNGTLSGALQGGIGSMLSGGGLSGFLNGAVGGLTNGISGALGGALSTITGGISGQVMGALSSIGSNILPSLSGVLPGNISNMLGGALQGAVGGVMGALTNVLKNPMNLPNAAQQFTAAGGLPGVVMQVASNMVGQNQPSGMSTFLSNMTMASASSSQANAIVGAVTEGLGQTFGNGPGGIGVNYRNANDMISYGATSISRNLPLAAANLASAGKFSTSNLTRLQKPGNIAAQIINKGLGIQTGLIDRLISKGIPILDVDNPQYDKQVQLILDSITDPTILKSVMTAFNMYVTITNLGQLTNIKHMMPDLCNSSGYKTFDDMGKHFISLGITQGDDFQQIGNVLGQIDGGIDLNHYSQLDSPFHKPTGDLLLSLFGYGGGTLGEITMVDFMGTAAGYVHTEAFEHITAANDYLMTIPEGKELARRIAIMADLINGKFTIPGLPINSMAEGGGGSGGGGN